MGLFSALPFKCYPLGATEDINVEEERAEEEERITFACLPFIPEISHQMRRALKKARIHTTFKSTKTKPEATKTKGVYKYTCKLGCAFIQREAFEVRVRIKVRVRVKARVRVKVRVKVWVKVKVKVTHPLPPTPHPPLEFC